MSDIPNQPAAEHADFSVGKILKAGREARGLSFDDVADKLKLTPRQLTALETDDFQALPGNTFVRGFVRNYARLLEIDSHPLLEHLAAVLPQERVQAAMPRVGDATALNSGASFGQPARSWPVWLMVVFGLLLGAGVVFWFLKQPAPPEVAMPAASEPVSANEPALAASAAVHEEASGINSAPFIMLPEASSTAHASAASAVNIVPVAPVVQTASRVAMASTPKPEAKMAAASAVADGGVIRVTVAFDSWVQIIDAEGTPLVSQLLGPGSERSVSGKPPFRVKVGNAPKTQLYYRGQQVDLTPYVRGDVATLVLK